MPAAVAAVAAGAPTTPVWANGLGGLTFAIGVVPDRYVKWQPAASGVDTAIEADRLRWAGLHTPVPEVLDVGADAQGNWLVTRAVPAQSAVSAHWRHQPEVAVAAIGRGLAAMHRSLPVDGCPWTWSVSERLEHLQPQFRDRRAHLAGGAPPIDRAVVCHGDPCAPNTLIGPDGSWAAHVDLGSLGVADRWADLAVASMSLEWNYGPGWDGAFFAGYGIDPDAERIAFYRDLWNCT